MIKRKKNRKNITEEKKSINDPSQINTSVKIPLYAPNQGLTPKEYLVSGQMIQLEESFKGYCEEFQSKSNPDEFNSSYMDAIIERVCVEAIKFIKVQRCDHVYTITKLLDAMHKGDYIKCKSKLEHFKRDKEMVQEELNKYRAIYYKDTSFEVE